MAATVQNFAPPLAGACLERMGGHGTAVNAYVGDKRPSTEIVSLFSFPEAIRKSMIQISLAELSDIHQSGTESSLKA